MEFCAFTEPQQGASYRELRDMARAAEQSGFAGFFRSDHYLAMSGDGMPGPSDAWTTLAALAVDTERIRLGTLVSSVTYRHPGILAIQVANVDDISGGRVELGLGTGWFEAEHRAYGIPFPAKRFGLLEEQLAIVTGLWATPPGETFSYAGEHYRLEDAPALPEPVQARIPVIVGGGGPRRTPELTARFATEYNYFGGEDPAVKFDAVRDAARAIDRDPDELRYSYTISLRDGFDAAEVRERVARVAELGASRVYLQIMAARDLALLDRAAREIVAA